jgi:hypothetical protein
MLLGVNPIADAASAIGLTSNMSAAPACCAIVLPTLLLLLLLLSMVCARVDVHPSWGVGGGLRQLFFGARCLVWLGAKCEERGEVFAG